MAKRGFEGAPDAQGLVWQRERVGNGPGWLVKDTKTRLITQAPGVTRYRAREHMADALDAYNWKPAADQGNK